MDRQETTERLGFSPLPYHAAVCDYLKAEERELWNWFASHRVKEDQADAVRLDLLKSTYRVDRQSSHSLYEVAEDVAARLSLDVPITIYQAQKSSGLNASLAYLPGEGHVVLHGPVSERLDRTELRALFAHELGHFALWRERDGDLLIVEQILAALTYDSNAQAPHFETARLFGLYMEIYCDRSALSVVGDPLPVVAMLVKIDTESSSVDAASYLRQAEEVVARGPTKSAGATHPEAFIRARALQLWHTAANDADRQIDEMVQGRMALGELDLLGQRQVAQHTRRLIDALLVHDWLQSEAVLAHARLFFSDYEPPGRAHRDEQLADDLANCDDSLQEYYCYVLLDFVSADRDLEEAPLAAALAVTEQLSFRERFAALASRELRLRKKQVDSIDKEKERILADAEKSGLIADEAL